MGLLLSPLRCFEFFPLVLVLLLPEYGKRVEFFHVDVVERNRNALTEREIEQQRTVY